MSETKIVERVHRLQIERVIRRGVLFGRAEAEFRLMNGWMCCKAWIDRGLPLIQVQPTVMSRERASAVAISIQMALDWIAEELASQPGRAIAPEAAPKEAEPTVPNKKSSC